MFSTKKTTFLMLALVCLLMFSCGCEEKTKPDSAISKPEPVKAKPHVIEVKAARSPALALNFADKAVGTYKATVESSKGVDFEGEVLAKSTFKGGKTGSNVEIVFSSEVVGVDEQGNAVLKITVKSVKYKAVVKDNPVVDFDSSRAKDKISPLFGLVGKSYTVKMATNGKMLSVVDAVGIREAVKGGSSTHKAAQALVGDKAIAQRHGSVILPADGKMAADATWKKVESFDFGLMGAQSYEKVYTVNSAEKSQVRISMNGLPSSEMAEEIHKEQQTSDFSKMFDNVETYEGKLVFDSVKGKVKSYTEKLDAQWIAVDPAANAGNTKGAPAALRMSVVKGFSIEKVN